jgi:ADP-ribose pyrophosphatase YjhB (NUDIX family)
LQQGVARELLEETGLEVQVLDMIEVFDRIFLDPGAASSKDRSRPKYHYVIVDYLCERLAGQAQAGSDVTDIAYATEEELEKFQMTSTANRVLRRAFAMDRERRQGR